MLRVNKQFEEPSHYLCCTLVMLDNHFRMYSILLVTILSEISLCYKLFFIDNSVFCNATFLFVYYLEVKCANVMLVASQNGKCQALIL